MNTKKKPLPLVLSRETIKDLTVSSSIRTGIVVQPTASIWCPHSAFCPPPRTSGCPM